MKVYRMASVITRGLFITALGFARADSPARLQGTVTVDYSSTLAQGSPYVFGASYQPNYDHKDAWDTFAGTLGISLVRCDVNLDTFFYNRKLTLHDYTSNANNIQDPVNWNWERNDAIIRNIKAHNMKVIGLIFYVPEWLAYNHQKKGVPVDWGVYQDIVKKIYQHYASSVDYFELLNESSDWLDLSGSPYQSTTAAAKDFYYYGVRGIRAVSTTAMVGGIDESRWNFENTQDTCMGPVLSDPRLVNSDINFITMHDYQVADKDGRVFMQELQPLKQLMAGTGRSTTVPYFLTEWGYSDFNTYGIWNDCRQIPFVASGLIQILNHGYTGACLYQFYPENVYCDENWDPWTSGNGLYSWDSVKQTATFYPPTRVYTVYANKMGLSAGKCDLKSTTFSRVTIANGAVNSSGHPVVIAANAGTSNVCVAFNLNNLPLSGRVAVEIYSADAQNDGRSPVRTSSMTVTNGSLSVEYTMPAESAVGIIVKGAPTSVR
jgi:hypothetical protein